ncbi:MAG: histone deacetylase [Deltaproteobacteria bacterium]|nr:histone deacetylase [Deltaproteobacteria bacterium]
MILYDDNLNESFLAFGIEIPVLASRAAKTFEFLKSHKVLGPRIEQWHIANIDEHITKEDLLRVHSKAYVEKLYSAELEQEIIRTFELIDDQGNYYRYNPNNATLPLTRIFDRTLNFVAGTIKCSRLALERDFCFAFSGGMHHGQKDYGNGFCMLNDIVIAIRKLQAENLIRTAWVIDTDAHKGDGTAALTKGDDTITTLSIHMGKGWPLDGEKFDKAGNLNLSFIASDIDIPIDPGEDRFYVAKLKEGLNKLATFPKPDLVVVVSGADPFEKDELPSTSDLKLSLEQMMQRDMLVYNFLKERDLPGAFLMAGGYGESSWKVYAQFLEWALLDRFKLDLI